MNKICSNSYGKLPGFLASFDHSLLSKGPVIQEQVHDFVKKLNTKVLSEKINGITFNSKYIKPELRGGACSAIALRIACPLLDRVKHLPSNSSWDCQADAIDFVELINKSESIEKDQIRSVQAAFNTIIVTSEKISDISQQKIRALAAFYDIKILYSTDEYVIEEGENFERKFLEQIKNLNQGVYLVRAIQEADNRKKESRGHSTIYIKDKKEELYFDPRLGLYKLNEQKKVFFESIYGSKRIYNLDNIKIHLLSK
ncbi:MAG: hypothetical protein H0X29_03090 [Parachlamydiaceae bacterium]|nr:hypothetical protein [Parachlamydiaceae bacterium]